MRFFLFFRLHHHHHQARLSSRLKEKKKANLDKEKERTGEKTLDDFMMIFRINNRRSIFSKIEFPGILSRFKITNEIDCYQNGEKNIE